MANLKSSEARVGRPAPTFERGPALRADAELLDTLLIGPWNFDMMVIRLSNGRNRLTPEPWMINLARHLLGVSSARPSAAVLMRLVSAYSEEDDGELSLAADSVATAGVARIRPHLPMSRILTRADLLDLLDLTEPELEWLADTQSRLARSKNSAPVHYRYRMLTTGRRARLLEIPKPRLMEIQRRLARHIVARLPLHPAAHGSVTGRSVYSCVREHAGSTIVIRCDLESFFASITDSRMAGLISMTGTDNETARLVAGLCTSVVPAAVRRELARHTDAAGQRRLIRNLATPHLPQGAPSSPGVANALGFGLDHRLASLAESLGARYTRYVDDLIFSGPAGLAVGALLGGVRDITREEGFRLAERKTAVLRSATRQQLLGAVLNHHPAISRVEMDRLRAVLHNCRTRGVSSQSRDLSPTEFRSYLAGKIAWVASINSRQGERLAQLFSLIDFSS